MNKEIHVEVLQAEIELLESLIKSRNVERAVMAELLKKQYVLDLYLSGEKEFEEKENFLLDLEPYFC